MQVGITFFLFMGITTLVGGNNNFALLNRWFIGTSPDVAYSSPHGNNLHPFVVMEELHFHVNTDNAICSQLVSFELHASECQLTCLIHGIGVLFEFATQGT